MAAKIDKEQKKYIIDKGRYRLYIWGLGLLLIFSLALGIRLHRAIALPERIRNGFGGFGDSFAYHTIACNLYKGNGFSSVHYGDPFGRPQKAKKDTYKPAITRGPAYPFFMYLIYKFFGMPGDMLSRETWRINWDRVRIAQGILDSTCCVLIFFIVRLICPGSLWAPLASSGIYSLSFYNIYYTKALLSESLATFLVTLFVLMGILSLKKERLRWPFFAGVAFGLVPLCRPEYVLFTPVFALFIFLIYRRDWKTALKRSMVCLLGIFIVISPWSLRNYAVFKKPILISKGGLGESIYIGTIHVNNETWKGWGKLPDDGTIDKEEKRLVDFLRKQYFATLIYGNIDEIQKFDDTYIRLALERIRNNPLRSLKNWIVKIPRLWYQYYIPLYATKEPKGWFFVFYFLFALYGFFTEKIQGRILMLPVCLLFIYLTVLFMPLMIEPRYGVALMPGIISIAGIGAWRAISSGGRLIFKFLC